MANKPLHFVEHEIEDNLILTNKKPNEFNRETVLLGAEKVTVGIAVDKQVIKVDPVTGLNYLTNQTDAQVVYNLPKQAHSCWFVIDLETGKRGWYPGSKTIADTLPDADVEIKSEMSSTSQTLVSVKNVTVDLLEDDKSDLGEYWSRVKYNEITGYVYTTSLVNRRYVDKTS